DASELREEPGVVLEEVPDVGDRVADHREPLHAEAESEAGVALGVDAAVGEDVGMDHPGSEHLEPACAFADAAALLGLLGAEDALDVYLCSRLDEREVARTEPHTDLVTVQTLRERRQDALELRERDPLVHAEPFHLIKHRRVRAVVVAATVDGAA